VSAGSGITVTGTGQSGNPFVISTSLSGLGFALGRWRRVATQTIPNNTNTVIQWDTEDADPDGIYTPSGGTFTTTAEGLYVIGVQVAWVAAPNNIHHVRFFSPSGVSQDESYAPGAAGLNRAGFAAYLPSAATFQIVVSHTHGSDRTISGAFLRVARLGT
jgi:hypothetical protein